MKSLFGGCHPGYDYYQLIINNVIIIIELLQSIKRKIEKKFLVNSSSYTSHNKDSQSKTTFFFKFMFLVAMC